jgi:hypothetical protein
MLVSINVIEDRTKSVHKINPFHVSRVCMFDPKDVDKGTVIFMKDGTEIFTPDPLDIVDTNICQVSDRFAAAIMVQVAGQYAKMLKPPRKMVAKK